MQVTCGRCHALYEFDSHAIPQGGYQAQCSHCHSEFFVAPARRQTHIERLFEDDLHHADGEAGHDGDADNALDLPLWSPPPRTAAAGSSDSRRGPAFVAAPPPRAPAGEAAPADGASAAASGPVLAAAPDAGEVRRRAIENEWASAPLVDAGEPLSARPSAGEERSGSDGRKGEQNDEGDDSLLARNDVREAGELSKQDAAAEAYRRRRRSLHRDEFSEPPEGPPRTRARMVVGLAASAVVVTGVVVGVIRSNSLHTPTQVTPPVHVVRDPSPAARDAFDAGVHALRSDTARSLNDAQVQFGRAIELEADYTDAWAGLGLAAWLAGIDARDEEARVGRELSGAVGTLALAAQAQGRDASAVHLSQGDDETAAGSATHAALALAASSLRLRTSVLDVRSASERLQASAGDAFDHLERAGAALLVASQLPAQTPLLATAAALWHSDGPWAEQLVPSQLAVAEQLVGELFPPERRSWLADDVGPEGVVVDRGAPWASWRMVARARLALRRASGLAPAERKPAVDAAIQALEGALRLEPGLRRAQWQLAQALALAERRPEAKHVLEELAHGSEPHPRAQAQLAQWAAAP